MRRSRRVFHRLRHAGGNRSSQHSAGYLSGHAAGGGRAFSAAGTDFSGRDPGPFRVEDACENDCKGRCLVRFDFRRIHPGQGQPGPGNAPVGCALSRLPFCQAQGLWHQRALCRAAGKWSIACPSPHLFADAGEAYGDKRGRGRGAWPEYPRAQPAR